MRYKHKIPLHLEVEDHIIAGLSARQLLLIGAGVAIGYLLWCNLAFLNATHWGLFFNIVLSSLPALSGMGAAFFRPASRGLEEWAIVGVIYLAQPKLYLWADLHDDSMKESDNHLGLSELVLEQEEE